jgi:hypothetical protein
MGSPELTKMADFVGAAGCPRSTERSRTWLRLRSKIGLARPERPRTGAGVAAPRRQDTAAAIAGTRS